MSKETTATILCRYLLEEYEVNYLRGRLLTLVESLGLPEKQEKAFMDLIKQEINKIWEYPAWLDDKTMEKVNIDRKSRNYPVPLNYPNTNI